MLTAGWQAHTLNAPGKFLISAPEHDTPRRARAYLVTDHAVTETASRTRRFARTWTRYPCAPRPSALGASQGRPERKSGSEPEPDDEDGPGALLWVALCQASEHGIPVADLVAATGRSHRWVNYRLKALADAGRAVQIRRGVWLPVHREGDAQ